MSTRSWIGGALGVPDIYYLIPGNVQIGNTFAVVINGKSIAYQTSVGTVADVVAGLLALVTASTVPPEFNEVTWSNNTTYLGAAAKTPGIPVTITASASISAGPSNQTPTFTFAKTLATPGVAAPTDVPGGGTLNFNTAYYYRVSAINAQGETLSYAEQTVTTSNNAVNTHAVAVTWLRVPGATGYRIYGRSTGAELFIAGVVGEGTLTYTDTGAITPSGALPGSNTTASNNQGPNCWGTAANWSGGAVPVNSDDAVVQDSSWDILYDLDQSAVTLNSLTVDQSFGPGNNGAGTIGLPVTNSSGYAEYRTLSLKVGLNGATIPLVIGNGSGPGSGRIKIDANNTNVAGLIINSGTPLEQGLESILIKNTATGSKFTIQKGIVGFNVFAGETGSLSGGLNIGFLTNVQGDARVRIGSGTTLPTVKKDGGQLEIYATGTITTFTQTAGETWHRAGATATLALQGGTFHENAAGTCLTTAVTVNSGAFLDFSQDGQAKTITPKVTLNKGCKFRDPLGIVSWTAGWTIPDGSLKDIDIDVGTNRTTYTVA